MNTEMLLGALTIVFGIVGYLLSQRDSKQAREIELLFKKHDESTKEVMELKLELAKNHYPKNELDAKFGEINSTLKEGFAQLDKSVREMAKSFTDHLQDHSNKVSQ